MKLNPQVIKEAEYDTLKDVLKGYSAEKVCSMRKRAREVYELHFQSLGVQLDTLLQVLRARTNGGGAARAHGVLLNPASS